MKTPIKKVLMFAAVSAALATDIAHAFTFQNESVQGSFDSTITLGFGRRLLSQDCGLVGDPNSRCGASANVAQYSNGDNGDLNYNKRDFFTTYLKGTHELLLKMPEGLKFMVRGTWLQDFKATDTRRTDLEDKAKDQIARDVRLLDFWGSKDFNIGNQHARLRVGNQVQNWGESIFASGGINATNSLDIQKLLIPGTQIKEAVLPAPMISLATGLGHGFNLDVYYQFRWNRNRVPPVGTYFSAGDTYNKGREALFLSTTNFNFGGVDAASVSGSRNQAVIQQFQNRLVNGDPSLAGFNSLGFPFVNDLTPRDSGQYGIALHYHPESTKLDLGFYYLNYHDKSPVLDSLANGTERWEFLENRNLFGVSANFPVGNWAIGWELSYRPKDAVALTGCYNPGGPLDANTNFAAGANCQQWIDNKKYQMHLTSLLFLTPGDHGPVLKALGADTATLTAEAVLIRYPGVSPSTRYFRTFNGVPVMQAPAAAYAFWADTSPVGSPVPASPIAAAVGTANSWGYTVDFNWVYDSTVIQGWQLNPGVTFAHSVRGDTPTLSANYLAGAKSANFYLNFYQNPTKWQAGLNYTTWWGGDKIRQPYSDRDFIGGFVGYNF